MEQWGQRLVDQEAQPHIQQTLEQGKRSVEGDKAAQQPIDGRQGKGRAHPGKQSVEGLDNLLIHADDHVDRQKFGVDRVGDEVIHRNTAQRHDDRPRQRTGQRAGAGLPIAVDKSRRNDEADAQQEVAHLPYPAGAGKEQPLDDVFYQTHHDPADRPQAEGRQQGGQLGEVQLHEGGDQKRDGELQEHKDGGRRREHGGNGDLVGPGPLGGCGGCCGRHKKYTPLQKYPKTLHLRSIAAKERSKARQYDHLLPSRLSLSVPDLHRFNAFRRSRTRLLTDAYRRWGLAPRPEDECSVVMVHYTHLRQKCKPFFPPRSRPARENNVPLFSPNNACLVYKPLLVYNPTITCAKEVPP